MSIYDDPDVQIGGDFVKFEQPGDSVKGIICAEPGKHEFPDGKKAIKLVIRTADGDKTLTAGQVQLASKLTETRPDLGDTVEITYTRSERRDGGKTLKHFDVKVTRGNGASSVPAAAADPTTDPF